MGTKIPFSKYQATGNDFILVDHRSGGLTLSRSQIAQICNRRFGVGGDGLILLNTSPTADFEMRNFNSDGGECTMCGNGGRALVQFAVDTGFKKEFFNFNAIDGRHEARVHRDHIELKMKPVDQILESPLGPMLDTGSPHLVISTKNLISLDVVREGRGIRNSPLFMPSGINVNFVEESGGKIFLRTYERGVEDETLSCGTGAIATALITHLARKTESRASVEEQIHCQGGVLTVRFTPSARRSFDDIWLIGPARKTFEGIYEL